MPAFQPGVFQPNVFQGANPQTVTPGVATLSLTSFAPQVNLAIIPATASLTTTGFAPQLQLGVVPGVASLVLTPFAPDVATPQTVTPGVASLVLAGLAPQANLGIIPATAALVTTAFAPTVLAPVLVTPGVAALVIGVFAPTATIAEPNNPNFLNHFRRGEVYPAIRGAVSEWAFDYYRQGQPLNNLDQSFLAPVVAIPATASLVLATFAPDVVATSAQVLQGHPGRPVGRRVWPPRWYPEPPVIPRHDIWVEPRTARLHLVGYRPSVIVTDDDLALLLLLEAA